jgi:hypothetical protein
MSKDARGKIKSAASRSWLGIAGLWGAGLFPCPDCGAPMLFHFWPLALALTLIHIRRGKQQENGSRSPGEEPAHKTEVGDEDTN